eukprot:1927272-Prymnesium_polylepis.1
MHPGPGQGEDEEERGRAEQLAGAEGREEGRAARHLEEVVADLEANLFDEVDGLDLLRREAAHAVDELRVLNVRRRELRRKLPAGLLEGPDGESDDALAALRAREGGVVGTRQGRARRSRWIGARLRREATAGGGGGHSRSALARLCARSAPRGVGARRGVRRVHAHTSQMRSIGS